MEKKENKKGFWASLFSPKPCACSCGDSLIVEDDKIAGETCGCSSGSAETIQVTSCCSATDKVKEIKVLGPGCAKCKTTYGVIERVIKTHNLDIKLTKVDDIAEMMSYNIMSTPAVVVDGVVCLKGHVPTETEVRTLLGI